MFEYIQSGPMKKKKAEESASFNSLGTHDQSLGEGISRPTVTFAPDSQMSPPLQDSTRCDTNILCYEHVK